MSLIGALTKAAKAGEAAKKTAPFYSAVDEALAAIKRPKGTGAEFYTELTKQAGVKKAELADRKLEQAFKAKGKMTKEEAQQVLKENPPPKLQEKTFTEPMDDYERDEALRDNMERFGYESWEDVPPRIMRQWNDELDENVEKYGDYRTAGGKNYREILLKLPQESSKITEAEKNFKLARNTWEKDPTQQNYARMQMAEQEREVAKITSASYRSKHWKEDPNVLAHMRVQDRVGPNGEKILHVEEIQSDWHQEGRKKGYKPEDYVEQSNKLEDEFSQLGERRFLLLKQAEAMPTHGPEFTNLMDEANSITPKLMQLQEQRDKMRDVINYGVPDAPFKKNWHELAMKRLLNYAADNGYDSIAITPGAEQAKRYSLSKQVDQVMATQEEGGLRLFARDKQGKNHDLGVHPTEKLADVVGKDLAEKMATQTKPNEIYQGVDLEVGGEGMKGFYDQILPSYLNTFGKPYNAQVQMDSTPVSTRDPKSTSWGGAQGEHPFITSQDITEPYDGMVELLRRNEEGGEHTLVGRMLRADSQRRMAEELMKLDTVNQIKLHNFPITPEMRESIKQKGLPLYQQVGIPTAGAGAASQMPEQMQEPEVEPEVKKAKGGRVRMTTNRDTMFMELSNKKLKRK